MNHSATPNFADASERSGRFESADERRHGAANARARDVIDESYREVEARRVAKIERVARAICKSRSCEGIWCCQWPANMGRLAKDCPAKRGGYDDAARAAIDAVDERGSAPE